MENDLINSIIDKFNIIKDDAVQYLCKYKRVILDRYRVATDIHFDFDFLSYFERYHAIGGHNTIIIRSDDISISVEVSATDGGLKFIIANGVRAINLHDCNYIFFNEHIIREHTIFVSSDGDFSGLNDVVLFLVALYYLNILCKYHVITNGVKISPSEVHALFGLSIFDGFFTGLGGTGKWTMGVDIGI